MNFGAVDGKYKADDILEAQAHVWKYIFNFINSMSLKCVVELGIPDAIYKYGKPMSLSILAATLFINPEKVQPLGRIMSILVRSGFIYENKLVVENNNEKEGYELTKVGELLLRENPLTVTPFLLSILNQEFTKPWHYLASWFQNGDKTAFQTANGRTLYEFTNNMPEFNEQFNAAMFSDSMLAGTCLFSNSEEGNFGKSLFKGLNSMVDVGGGTGTMTKIIGHACPHLSCICYDLPNVVAGLQGTKNITFVAGDMFKGIPQADVVLLKESRVTSVLSREIEQHDRIIADREAEIAWLEAQLVASGGELREQTAALETVMAGLEGENAGLKEENARLQEALDQANADNRRISDRVTSTENELSSRLTPHEVQGALQARLLEGLNVGRRIARMVDLNFPVELINQRNRSALRRADLVAEPRDSQGGPPAL